MHRVKNLFEQVCSMRNLRLAAKEALRGKRWRLPGATFFAQQEKELPALHEELRDGTYTHGAHRYFWIHDPKDRLVAAAPFRDRVVHHAIVRAIEPIFEHRFIEDSFACRRGKGTHAAMRRALHFARETWDVNRVLGRHFLCFSGRPAFFGRRPPARGPRPLGPWRGAWGACRGGAQADVPAER